MANTFTQIYIHVIFSVKHKSRTLPIKHKEDIHKYIIGIVKNRNQLILAINSVSDHIHLLIGYRPHSALSDLVRDIKANSSKFINEHGWVKGRFEWQVGYGAFSCSRSHKEKVIEYIEGQEQHHKVKTFQEEYLEFLDKYGVEYNEKYVFDIDSK